MTRRIGLISDPHARPEPLRQALDIFAREGVDEIICAGDIAGYFDSLDATIELLQRYRCKTIIGNHDQSFIETADAAAKRRSIDFLRGLPQSLTLEIERKRVFVVHAQPPSAQHGGIKLLDQNGEINRQQAGFWQEQLSGLDYDVLVVGHTHQVFAERLGDVFVLNPGSTAFNHSCMILDLPGMTVQTFALGGKAIVKCWNFSLSIAAVSSR